MILEKSLVRKKTHRLISSKYPTIGIFDDITDEPEDLKAGFIFEVITNDRFLLLHSRINLIPDHEIVSGNTASLVMAAYLHANEKGGRFNSWKLGAWYASLDVETALAETFYHADRNLRLSESAFPSKIQIRELIADIDQELIDIRNRQVELPFLYQSDPAKYQLSQEWSDELRWPSEFERSDENGIIYNSVRKEGGENVCIFWPTRINLPVNQGDHYEYNWDKEGNSQILKLTNIEI
ncbi:MAG: RES family NAD+ phosphorylase [Rhodobacteraceae bacterium]|nr:RES family NAD+ phosphorylase [Paracoccaceae bacterium]